MKQRVIGAWVVCVGLLAMAAGAETPAAPAFKVASLFSDHMVLQRDRPVPVWGWAAPGATVTVELRGPGAQKKSGRAGDDGRWLVTLDPLKASAEPATLVVSGADGIVLTARDVVVGEVWLASGQSNMAFTLNGVSNAVAYIAAANDPLLRQFGVPQVMNDTPAAAVDGTWVACATNTAASFSAVAYFFGRDLRKALGVPVGLIKSAWGGTPAQAWTPRATLEANTNLAFVLARYNDEVAKWDDAKADADYRSKMALYTQQVAKAKAEGTKAPNAPRAASSPMKSPNRPSCLFNAMIAPLQPYALRGVIWYQGESDNSHADEYRTLFPAMIGSWRSVWGADMPFLFVQIAPHGGMSPAIRDAQLFTMRTVPRTAMAVITDYGEAKDIHPKQKEPVGARLALAARALAYGEAIEYSGPLYESMTVNGDRVTLHFAHVGGGLEARGGALKGFVVAGANQAFTNAEASVEGNAVVVHNAAVTAPVAVRYGYVNVPDVNLYNKEGLPASPFRTDTWGPGAPVAVPARQAP